MSLVGKSDVKSAIIFDANKYDLNSFYNELSDNGDLLFFGGYIRDILMDYDVDTRDIDIVYSSKKNTISLDEIVFKNFSDVRKNKFNGLKINHKSITIDIWEISDTWAFKNNILINSVNNLSKSTFLNFDSVVYNYNSNKLIDEVFMKAVKSKILDVQLKENPDIELNLTKNLVQIKKYDLINKENFTFSNTLKNFYRSYTYTNEDSIERLYNRHLKRYKEEKLTYNDIKQLIDYILLK